VISISLIASTDKNRSDCTNIIRKIVAEKPKNFPIINSYLLIGLERIRKIVFHSISLKSN
jgi:hypothetical protein